MAINWFEGGRRITTMLLGIVLLAGAGYVFLAGGGNSVVVESSEPSQRLRWTLKDCDYPDQSRAWPGTIEFQSGDPRAIVACFRANKDGRIYNAYGPDQQVQLPAKGAVTPPPITYRKMLEVEPYTDEADAYLASRMAAFRFTQAEERQIADGQWMISWVHFWGRVKQAMPWALGSLFAIWLLTALFGWIVRGFAGIPFGSDFKAPDTEQASRTVERFSFGWLLVTMPLLLVLWGGAAGVIAATSYLSPHLGKFFDQAAGLVFVAVLFALAALGGFGLLLLYAASRRREMEQMPENAWVAASLINLFFVTIISFPINAYTVVGTWMDGVDHWSRAGGYSDAGTMVVFSICLLWPFIPLAVIAMARIGKIKPHAVKSVID